MGKGWGGWRWRVDREGGEGERVEGGEGERERGWRMEGEGGGARVERSAHLRTLAHDVLKHSMVSQISGKLDRRQAADWPPAHGQ